MAESTSDLADWQKCFSKSRQRDYYFNPKTGESLWSWEEVVEACARRKPQRPDNKPKPKELKKVVPAEPIKDRKPNQMAKPEPQPYSSSFKIPKIKARQDSVEMSIDPEEEDEKMEIEIVENVSPLRLP